MFRVTIKTKNDAFQPDPRAELARILRNMAILVETELDKEWKVNVLDVNGNTVGSVVLSK